MEMGGANVTPFYETTLKTVRSEYRKNIDDMVNEVKTFASALPLRETYIIRITKEISDENPDAESSVVINKIWYRIITDYVNEKKGFSNINDAAYKFIKEMCYFNGYDNIIRQIYEYENSKLKFEKKQNFLLGFAAGYSTAMIIASFIVIIRNK